MQRTEPELIEPDKFRADVRTLEGAKSPENYTILIGNTKLCEYIYIYIYSAVAFKLGWAT